MRTSRTLKALAAFTAAGLMLAACSSDTEEEPNGSAGQTSENGTDTESGDETGDDNGGEEVSKDLTVGVPAGWDEGVAVSHLWKVMLEERGYDVELVNADIGVIFTAMAGGDHDLLFDVWLPATHESYLENFGDQIEDLGSWYEGAALTIAVNSDSPAQTIADLAEYADDYDGRLVGIDAGAGITQITQDEVIPTYGLEDLDYVLSSTAAMLADLQGADREGRNIAVTLWRPHWAYDAYDIRDLEDPEGTMGDAELIHTYARDGFSTDHPELAEWISNFTFSDEQLASLENLMLNENEGEKNDESAAQWLEENPDFAPALFGEN